MEHLTTKEQIDSLWGNPDTLFLFKFSHRCPVSAMARSHIEKFEHEHSMPFFIIDVIDDRDVSIYVEEKTGIKHESPQIFLLKKGKILWSADHFQITSAEMGKALKKA